MAPGTETLMVLRRRRKALKCQYASLVQVMVTFISTYLMCSFAIFHLINFHKRMRALQFSGDNPCIGALVLDYCR